MTATANPQADTASLDARMLRDAVGTFPAASSLCPASWVGVRSASPRVVHLHQPRTALVSFSVARTSNTWPALRDAGEVGVSVLADHHDMLCRQPAGPAGSASTTWHCAPAPVVRAAR